MIEVLPPPVAAPPQQQAPSSAANRLRYSAQLLLGWRTQPGFGWIEAAVFVLYSTVLALMIPRHEPWSDEAQAWLLARDSSIWQIVAHRMHYEGAPPLWHIVLKLFQYAGGSFHGMSWLGAVLAAAGIFVMLRWSPFPLLIRILLPFTFFLQYQYAVVARSYNLFPLLTFALCALYGNKRRVLWFAAVAGLLANVSMQGTEIAALLCALYAWDLFRERGRLHHEQRRRIVAAAMIYAALAFVAFYSAIPAPDVDFAVTDGTSKGSVHQWLDHLIGEMPPIATKPPRPGPFLPPVPANPMPELRSSPRSWAAWQIENRPDGNPTTIQSAAEAFVSFISQATWPVATSNILACVFLGLLALWLRARRSLRFLLPWISLMVVGLVIWVADHHMGMVFVALLGAIWIAAARNPWRGSLTRVDLAFTLVFAAVLALQVGWSVSADRKDLRSRYDPGVETAAWLQAHPVARTAAFNYWTTSIQPYFTKNPFFNLPTPYRIWSSNTNPDPYYQEIIDQHPDRIVYAAEFTGPGGMRNQWIPLNLPPTAQQQETLPWDQAVYYFHTHGYVETHRFCGVRYARLSDSFTDCDLIFEPVQSQLAKNGDHIAASVHQLQQIAQRPAPLR